jgi:hypothetical protein
VQSGTAKKLTIRLRQADLRSNSQAFSPKDSNEFRVPVDYPIKLL